jgi:N6-adenosine-specific RNA methylase IME4
MPALTPIEFEGLKADVAQHGVLVPVEVDEQGNILDGHHRVRAWEELRAEGVTLPDYPRMVRTGMTEEAKRNHARRLNVMRRQLNREQREEVMRAMRADGMSLRQIGKVVGVDVSTVHKAVAKSGVGNPTPAHVTGADGKTYPAERKPVAPLAPAPALFVDDEDCDDEEADVPNRYTGGLARCKYCWETHTKWEYSPHHDAPTWVCEYCDHATADEHMDLRTPTPPSSRFVPGGAVTLDPVAAEAQVKQERQEVREARRVERVEKINAISRGNAPLAAVTSYPVIYADPPWRYEHSRTDNRQIENHYPTMDLAQICALPVGEVAAPDAVLFLWATSPKLAESMQVIDAWGFTYRTCMVWDKEVIGMGYYARQQHELLLIATRGNLPTPEPANRPPSVVRVRRSTEHSEKPAEFYALIESMYPEYARIELFARNARPGWAAWGNQAND